MRGVIYRFACDIGGGLPALKLPCPICGKLIGVSAWRDRQTREWHPFLLKHGNLRVDCLGAGIPVKMSFDQDVEFYATYLADKQGRSVTDDDREDVRELLDRLIQNDRLLPRGGVTQYEYGLRLKDSERVMNVGRTAFAEKNATHRRRSTAWVGEGPNDDWARFTSEWEPLPWFVLGVTKDEWDQKVAEAEAAGLGSCHYCGFKQYRNHKLCVKCGVPDWDYLE